MILISDKSSCCGCGGCEQVCPKECITMKRDTEGFLYPIIDEKKCVDCGLCDKSCPVNNASNVQGDARFPKAFGGWHKDDAIRYESSSGGVFTLFAEKIISEGGVVFGCSLNADKRAVHTCARTIDELAKLRGSKYVQSEIGTVYAEIKSILKGGNKVLFAGTPCQAAGLHSFMGNVEHENLYIVDFICHGVPSPEIFRAFLEEQEKKRGSKLVSHRFRNKDHGWSQTGLQLGTYSRFDDGTDIRRYPAFRDTFMNGFLDDVYLRPSCYECNFKSISKNYADFTIADFWGVDKVDAELNDGKGTSLVLVNTEHGEKLWKQVNDKFYYKEVEVGSAVKRNKPLVKSARRNPNREYFFRDYQDKGFRYVEKKYMSSFVWALHKVMNSGWQVFGLMIRSGLQPVLKLFHIKWTEEDWTKFLQFVKFALVGFSNSLISYSINMTVLFLLRGLQYEFDYIIANLSGFSLSVLWSFYWNNRYVFKVEKGSVRSKWQTLLKTYAVYGFSGIVLNNVLSTIWIQVLGFSRFVAPLLNLPITVPVNFAMNKLWAYRTRKKSNM